jgi:hypothetical protein
LSQETKINIAVITMISKSLKKFFIWNLAGYFLPEFEFIKITLFYCFEKTMKTKGIL